jgi:hypothetical protein
MPAVAVVGNQIARIEKLHFAGNLVCLKLYAAADHWPTEPNRHLEDLRALAPSADELRDALGWATTHDSSDGFRELALAVVRSLMPEEDGRGGR